MNLIFRMESSRDRSLPIKSKETRHDVDWSLYNL